MPDNAGNISPYPTTSPTWREVVAAQDTIEAAFATRDAGILALHREGASNRAIAHAVGLSHVTIANIITRTKESAR